MGEIQMIGFGDMQSRSPPRPIDSLEKQQAHALHQACHDGKPYGEKQEGSEARAGPGAGGWNLACRWVTRHSNQVYA